MSDKKIFQDNFINLSYKFYKFIRQAKLFCIYCINEDFGI